MIIRDPLTPEATQARAYVLQKYEMALVRFFSRVGKYKVLPYGAALAKNALGVGETRDAAWIDARKHVRESI
jgi:hypothetical protein